MLFNIAMEICPFIDGLPIKNGYFPWLCQITRWYIYIYIDIPYSKTSADSKHMVSPKWNVILIAKYYKSDKPRVDPQHVRKSECSFASKPWGEFSSGVPSIVYSWV